MNSSALATICRKGDASRGESASKLTDNQAVWLGAELALPSFMSSQDRLRIAFVADTLHSASGGGILSGEYVVNRWRKDHDVVSVGADGDDLLPAFQLPFRAMRESSFVMARPNRSVLAKTFRGSEVVHLQFPFWLSFAALDEAKKLGLPVVAGFHVQPENALYNVGIHSTWLNDGIYRTLIKHFYNKVDAVICPTAFAEEKLRSHGLTTRTVVISNGVPPDVAEMAKKRESRKPSADGKFFILAVGRLAAEKRQDVIIEAVRRSRHKDQIRLVLSGAGPREAALKELASALPNGAEIGFLPRETLLEHFVNADLFIHASEVELEGMAVLESMSAGLPALIADAPESAASRFALNDDFSFKTGDAAALSAKIDALIEDRAKLEAAREPYRARAQQFDFDASVEKLAEVYRSVIVNQAAPASVRRSA
jgi:1,2-diacylglycerol 3-alpha-glucosyltransferase